jgi:hypothetical protein
MTGRPEKQPPSDRTVEAEPVRDVENLGLKVLLGELEALSHLLPCADQNTGTQDGAEDAFDNMPV